MAKKNFFQIFFIVFFITAVVVGGILTQDEEVRKNDFVIPLNAEYEFDIEFLGVENHVVVTVETGRGPMEFIYYTWAYDAKVQEHAEVIYNEDGNRHRIEFHLLPEKDPGNIIPVIWNP